jgi:uncharacterized membrane protein YccC
MQASVGGSLKATIDRLTGTVIGAVWGAALGAAIPHPGTLATGGLMAAALLPLAALVAWWPSFRVAPVTAIIVLLVPHGDASPVEAAIERLIEIALGCAVALGVALAITPSRAHRLLSAAAADALTPMRDQILLLLAGITEPVHPAAVIALHDRIRGAIERCVAAAADAGRERTSYLTDAPDPDPLVRSLRRISHDLIMLARLLPKPLPEPLSTRLTGPAKRFGGAAAEFLTELADALNRKSAVPSLAPLQQALSEYEDVIAELRRDRLIVPLNAEDAERVFGTAFALQQLVSNLADLADRVGELSSHS